MMEIAYYNDIRNVPKLFRQKIRLGQNKSMSTGRSMCSLQQHIHVFAEPMA